MLRGLLVNPACFFTVLKKLKLKYAFILTEAVHSAEKPICIASLPQQADYNTEKLRYAGLKG